MNNVRTSSNTPAKPESIDYSVLLYTVKRYIVKLWPFLIAIAIAVWLLVSAITGSGSVDVYRSSTRLYVFKSETAYSSGGYSSNYSILTDSVGLVQTDMVMNRVNDLLSPYEIPAINPGAVSVSITEEGSFLDIAVTDIDPTRASIYANTLAEVLLDTIPQVILVDNIRRLDEAPVPAYPYSSSGNSKILPIACGLGAALAVLAVFVWLDKSIVNADVFSKYFDVPVLGTVSTTTTYFINELEGEEPAENGDAKNKGN